MPKHIEPTGPMLRQLRAMYYEGLTYREMGRAFGIERRLVGTWIASIGLPDRRTGRITPERTRAEELKTYRQPGMPKIPAPRS